MSVQRMAASLALMAGPGLGAHWLLSPMRAHDPHQAVATAVLVLEAEQAGLERWLKEADRGRSPEQLRRQLRQHELALVRISPADCTLLVHAEMQHLQGRLAEQLPRKPKPPPGWPSWQKRFGPQIQAAQTNLEQCRSASKIARS